MAVAHGRKAWPECGCLLCRRAREIAGQAEMSITEEKEPKIADQEAPLPDTEQLSIWPPYPGETAEAPLNSDDTKSEKKA